jgi:hypothetical protein
MAEVKRLPDIQHAFLVDLAHFNLDTGGFALVQTPEALKVGNLLLRRGMVIRGEFGRGMSKRYGFKIAGPATDYLIATEPDEFKRGEVA